MAQPFSFPPPPPPPPKAVQHSFPQYQSQRGSGRGRGNFSQPYNNRGRGNSFSRRGYGRGSNQQSQQGGYQKYDSTLPAGSQRAGQKRDHKQAFQQRNHTQRNNRPLAPPAVPSFGPDINSLLPTKLETPTEVPVPSSNKKVNLLGLTPAAQADESSDDEGEESKLATQSVADSQFEHGGQVPNLSTPEDIAAWIAERRKRWPTKEKRDQAEKEAEERAKKREEERVARQEAGRAAAQARQEKWQKQKLEKEKSQLRQRMLKEQIVKAKTVTNGEPQSAAQLKAERLRKKAEKIAGQLKVAEAAIDVQDKENADDDLEALIDKVDVAAARQALGGDIDADISSDSSEYSDQDDTSSSGSSDSEVDSDDAPEELSSKQDGPEKARLPPRKLGTDADTRPLCTNFAKFGKCKFGRKCRYKHPRPDNKANTAHQSGARRKGLYQVMVEKEQEEERRRALKAIIALGDAGMLDDPPGTAAT